MRIWVDADACPNVIKEILFRAAKRTCVRVTLVANHVIQIPVSPYIDKIVVPHGFDVADKHIVEAISIGDLVITADIPLANLVVEKGILAINPRGNLYTMENIKHCLAMRNLMTELREGGIAKGGPDKLGKKELSAFANQLDRLLAKK